MNFLLNTSLRRIGILLLVFCIYGCHGNDEIPDEGKPDVDMLISIISPQSNRDYSFYNDGCYGIFENPSDLKKFKGIVLLSTDRLNISYDSLIIKWESNLDGLLSEGKLNTKHESEITTTLSRGLHIITFAAYWNNHLIEKDSIIISNVIQLKILKETGRSVKLNWSKYEGKDFLSYLIYAEDIQPVAEIRDINTVSFECEEQTSLIDDKRYQVIVKTENSSENIQGSNIVTEKSGIFIKIPYRVSKIIKDPYRSKVYATVVPLDKYYGQTQTTNGLLIIDSEDFCIESQILIDKQFSDLDISPDGNFLYLTQIYVDSIMKINLNDRSVFSFKTDSYGWGLHKIEVGNDNLLYCHRTPPTSGSSDMFVYNAITGEELYRDNQRYSHGDLEYNNLHNRLYKDNTNTTGGNINSLVFQNNSLYSVNTYDNIVFPSPYIFVSDDFESVFWENFQFDYDLNWIRSFDTKMVACSPANLYLSDLNTIYNFDDLSVKIEYPPFPRNESTPTVLFMDDNTIITSKTFQINYTNYPAETYFFKIKIQ